MELAEPMDGRVGSGRRPLKGLNWSQTRNTTDIPWLLVGATNLPILIRIILKVMIKQWCCEVVTILKSAIGFQGVELIIITNIRHQA